jgi:hypothetical protein
MMLSFAKILCCEMVGLYLKSEIEGIWKELFVAQ